MPDSRHETLIICLEKYGADLSRWPEGLRTEAREALLRDPSFRHAWEPDRDVERMLVAERASIDGEVMRSGAAARVRSRLLKRVGSDSMAALPWRAIAAAVLVAGMLGSAFDLVLPDNAETQDVAMLDPLDAVDGAGGP
jgi:hypothetical protein